MGDDRSVLWSIGMAGIALAVVLSMVAGVGTVAAQDNSDDDDEVFSEPVEIEAAGLTIAVGPPEEGNDEGVYSDINGDGEVTGLDAVLHAVVVAAVEDGELDLTDEQADAVDIEEDGDVDYEDALAIFELAYEND